MKLQGKMEALMSGCNVTRVFCLFLILSTVELLQHSKERRVSEGQD